jgi:hypothetical protein
VFFDPRELEHLLEDIDEFMESEDEKREMERIWRDAEIRSGRIVPGVHARECAPARLRSIFIFRDGAVIRTVLLNV